MKIKKDFVILMGGRVMQAIIALAAIRLLTSLLDKENVGMTYVVTSVSTYFSLVFINPLGMYINRKLHAWNTSGTLKFIFKKTNIYFLIVSFLSIPSVLAAYYFLGVGNNFLFWQLCTLVFLNIYIGTWFQTLCPSLNMLEHRKAFVLINLFSQSVGLFASVVGIFAIQSTAWVWLLGTLIGQFFGALLSWRYFTKEVFRIENSAPQAPLLMFNRGLLEFCIPIAFTTAFMWIQTQSYRLIVDSKLGAEKLAYLGVGLGVAASISGLVESLVTQYLYPKFYSSINSGNKEARKDAWESLFESSIVVFLPTSIYVFFAAPFILRLLVSSQFVGSLTIVMLGAAIELFRVTTNIIYAVAHAEMRTRSTILPYFLGASTLIVGLGLLKIFSDAPSITTVAEILVAAGFVLSLSMYWQMKKLLPIRIRWKPIFTCIAYSVPFTGLLAFGHHSDSFAASFLFCGFSGSYLLWIIYRMVVLTSNSKNS